MKPDRPEAERFGMRTRTELILLQRTMVVVEGVARSLNPQMNMWETARPVVTDYIRTNLGPQAVARDLMATVRILARLGPQLPQMAEAALIRGNVREPEPKGRRLPGWAWGLGGVLTGAALVARGEFSIVIASLTVASGAVDGELAALATAYVLLMAVLGPVAARVVEPLARKFTRKRDAATTATA